MEDTDSMTFRQQLLTIDGDLGKDEIEALKFLCSDLIALKKLETVKSAYDVFQLLINKDYINKEDPFLIAELLYRIKHNSSLLKLGYKKDDVQMKLQENQGKVSEYRQMLYEISEQLAEEDVRAAIFLLREHLPKKQSSMSALSLLTSLEKQDLLAETNLYILEETLRKISPDLLNRVIGYKQKKAFEQERKESLPSSVRIFSKQSFGKNSRTVSLQEPSIKYPPKNDESESLKEYVGIIQSSAANQEVEAGSVADPSGMSLQQSMGGDESKTAAEKPALYKMDGPHRGHCLIFNNVDFKQVLRTRMGSQKDAKELERVFKWLGLDVKKYDDQTSVQMKEILQEWKSSENWKDSDCFICCILSHGKSGNIYGTDSILIPIRTITSYFTAKACPLLAEKPKLFFIQACQGEKTQQPVQLQADTSGWLGDDAQSSGFATSQQMASSIPEEADFLLGMATVDGYLSFRHTEKGTWYIQALCNKLQQLVPRGEDILSILTEVNEEVSKQVGPQGLVKQMPQPAYTLRKKLIFPAPSIPFPQKP
ncbi:caspase-10 [Hemicordylus capensis]|uniref:caspase-10 n=1 Tax=Hemicordylus capensis TaxID=884348 RepID=UPI0023026EAD|nr:caspase-10 [Hemicordylus capensis]XP_053135583.1 caspase-10 [Hemicordylus capensis]XP_053135585.1 caspase-10 [Hemicordylus capensis]XP_053135594.1 caspase-10 [Hemicordylus capensis]XP_053135604.1 caspase-10 [Hemicordylus capensis]XP_053135614.1 caspase-10 [Hemicordylus capensis]